MCAGVICSIPRLQRQISWIHGPTGIEMPARSTGTARGQWCMDSFSSSVSCLLFHVCQCIVLVAWKCCRHRSWSSSGLVQFLLLGQLFGQQTGIVRSGRGRGKSMLFVIHLCRRERNDAQGKCRVRGHWLKIRPQCGIGMVFGSTNATAACNMFTRGGSCTPRSDSPDRWCPQVFSRHAFSGQAFPRPFA